MSVFVREMPCQELVELVTAYLEGYLAPAERTRFEEHLATCSGCRTYLQQMRMTLRALGASRRVMYGGSGISIRTVACWVMRLVPDTPSSADLLHEPPSSRCSCHPKRSRACLGNR